MGFPTGDIKISNNFELNSGIAIDARYIVATFSDLANISFKYGGLISWVTADSKHYKLANDLTTWSVFGGSGGTGNDYTTAGLVYKVNNINPINRNVTLTTSNINEGSNFYFTNTRVNTNVNVVKGLQGFLWGNHSTAGYVKKVNNINPVGGNVTITTSNIAEGSNLYYTDARVNANNNVVKGVQGFLWGNHSTSGYVKKVNNINPVSGNVTLGASNINIGALTLTNLPIVTGESLQVVSGKLQSQLNNRWNLLGNNLLTSGILGGTSGSFPVYVYTNTKPVVIFNTSTTSNPTNNYIAFNNAITNSSPTIETVGFDASIPLKFKFKSSTTLGTTTLTLSSDNVSTAVDSITLRAQTTLTDSAMNYVVRGTGTGVGGHKFFIADGATQIANFGNTGNITLTSLGNNFIINGSVLTFPNFRTRIGASAPTGVDYITHSNSDIITTSTGTHNYRSMFINNFINTTGGSANIYGIYYTPTITTQVGATIKAFASDLLVSGSSNYNLYLSGTALNYLNGQTGIMTLPISSTALLLPASTTTVSSLRITNGTAPTTPIEGDMWGDSTQKAMAMYIGGTKVFSSNVLYANTASVTITNTTTETSLFVSGSSTLRTLGANLLVAGKILRIRGGGVFSTPVTASNFIIKVKLGATIIAQVTTSNLTSSATNLGFMIDTTITCYTTGVSGSTQANGNINYTGSSSVARGFDDLTNSGNSVTTDTTTTQIVDVTAQWDSATTSRILKITNLVIEILN